MLQIRYMKVLMVFMGILLLLTGSALAQGQTTQLDVLMTDSTGTVSMQLPAGWTYQEGLLDDFPNSLVFGDSQLAISVRADNANTDLDPKAIVGNGGAIALFDPAEVQALGDINADLLQELFMQELMVPGRIIGPNVTTIAGMDALQVVARTEESQEEGILAVAGQGDVLLLLTVTSPMGEYDAMQDVFADMLATLSVAGVASDEVVSTPEVEVITTPEVAPEADELVYVTSAGDEVSLLLPDGWLYDDLMATENLFVWGNSDAALDTRYEDFTGVLTAIEGEGGLVLVASVASMGLTRDEADPAGILENIMIGLQTAPGYELVEQPTAFSLGEGNDGEYMVVRVANEYGYIAVVLFENDISIITSTGTLDSFEDNRDLLTDVLLSIRVPAAPVDDVIVEVIEEVSGQTVVAESGVFSVELPDGWVADTTTVGFEDGETLYFGSNEAFLVLLRDGTGTATGAGGLAIILTSEYADPSGTLDIDGLFDESLVDAGLEVSSLVTTEVNGAATKWGRVSNPEGYWTVYDSGDYVVLLYLFTSEGVFAQFDQDLQDIILSVQFP